MKPFDYLRPDDVAGAVATVAEEPTARYLAGGTNLVDHLRLGITSPGTLVDVLALGLDEITETDTGLRVGAGVTNTDLAVHPVVRRDHPVLARALLAGASGQIRNQASTAGNLLQRTRCVYFQDRTTPCNKREPGSGCSADDDAAYTRYNAVLGTSPSCVAVHPSDLAVALAVLEPQVLVAGTDGERTLAYADLHRLPGTAPDRDTTLTHSDLITGLEIPAPPPRRRSTYRKVRDRASYAFALVSVAATVVADPDGSLSELRVAWGGVAHVPWRARTLEERLLGTQPDAAVVRAACAAELEPARTHAGSAYKLELVTRTTELVLGSLLGGGASEAVAR